MKNEAIKVYIIHNNSGYTLHTPMRAHTHTHTHTNTIHTILHTHTHTHIPVFDVNRGP